MLKSHKRNSNNVQNSQQSQNFIGNSQLQSQNKLLLSNNQNLGNQEDNKKQEKKKLTYQEEQILREKREDFILDLQEHYDSVNETLEKLIYIKKELNSYKINDQEKIQHQKGVNLNREIKNSSIRVQKLKVGNRLKTVLDEQQQNQLKLNEEEKEKFEKQKQLKKKQMYNNNKKMNELLDQLNDEEMENQEKIKRDQQIREKEEEDNILEKFLQKKQNIQDNEENFQQMIDQEKKYGDSLFEEDEGNRDIQNEKQQKEAEFFQEKEKNLRQMINSFMKVSKNDPNFSYKYHNLDLYFKGQQQLEDFIECAPKKNLKQQLDKQKIKQQKDQINMEEIQADHQLTALHRINLINQEITDELNAQFHKEKMSQINKIFMDHHKEQWSKSGQQKERSKNQLNQQKKVEEKKPFLHVRPLMTKAIKEKLKNQEYKEEDRLLAEGTIIPIQQLYLNSHPNNPFIENLFGNMNKLNGDKILGSTFGPESSSGNKKMFQSQKLNKDIKVQNQNESKIVNQIQISKGSEQDGENLFTEEQQKLQQKYKNTCQSDSFKKQISYNQEQIKKKAKNSFDKNQLEEYFTYLKSNKKKENSQLSTLNSTLLKSPRNENIQNNINNENQSQKFKTQGNFFSQKLNQNQDVNNINEKLNTNEKNNEILGKMNRTQSSSYLQLDNQKIANNSSLNFLQKYEFLKNQSSSINNKNKLQYNYENFYKQNQSKQKVIDLNDLRANTGEKQKSRQMYYLNEKGQKFKSEQSRIEYLQKYENDNVTLYLSRYGTSKIRMTSPRTTFQGDGGGNQNEYNSYDINQNQQGNLFSKTSMGRFRNTSENQNLSQKYNQNNNQDLNQKLRYNLVNLTKLNGDQWIMQ
ncbi:hypothetical protein PPERSA_03131 [Pseudocohnilembus persalinus]|uniref:Uncharacterized protein n=1 Tax=Pseudocohnilembus persalinus TaxID=266149 RepID=A0A0V0QJ45_PSEPJ|nr:hypothetical protein PPERSA_03131 [Pseudocohnilembus persalinus]|eukprot:KRX02069.1 hypothetical protein PPERSA_03131 [Pseudocohnilembus persalinus]